MNISNIKTCEVCGDENGHNNKLTGMILCSKHAQQFRRFGKFIENTRFDINSYTTDENFAYIDLRNKYGEVVGITTIDIEDLGKIIQYRMHMKVSNRKNAIEKLKYAMAKVNNKNVRVHSIIMDGINHDHIDNDGLNNRKTNLRKITVSKNGMNKRIQSNNTSGVVGVSLTYCKSWKVQIKKNNITNRLGSYRNFDEAVKVRIIGESNFFKEYSNNYNHGSNTIQLTYLSHDDNQQTFIECNLQGEIIKFEKLGVPHD